MFPDQNQCTPALCRNGGSCVDNIVGYTCNCREGYAGVNCEYACPESSDVIFAIDASMRRCNRENYYEILQFVKDIAEHMNFPQSQLGLVTYNGEPRIDFHLNEYQTKQQSIDGISFNYSPHGSNTGPAIRIMTEEMFVRENGNRPGVRRLGVVLTDGNSGDRDDTRLAAALARANNITLLALNVGSSENMYDLREFRAIANDPNEENIYQVGNTANLDDYIGPLMDSVCNGTDI